MPVNTSLRVKQDYLLSMKQAENASGGLLDPKKLLIKSQLRIELQTKKEPNGAVLMLLEKDVNAFLRDKSLEVESKISRFVENNKKNPSFLEKKVGAYTEAIKMDFQKEVDATVRSRLKRLARDDRNLTEARIVVVFKAVGGTVKLAGQAARLAGGDASAIVGIAKSIKSMAELALKAIQTEEQRLNKLLKQKKKLKNSLDSLEKARLKSGGLVRTLKKAKQWFSWKKECGNTESARKDYRNSVTKSRKKIQDMAKPLVSMEKAMKSATTLKEGVQLGARVMDLKRVVRVSLEDYQKKEQKVDVLKVELAGLGVDVDDRTWPQKLKGFEKAVDSRNYREIASLGTEGAKAGNEIYGLAKEIKTLAENIQAMV